MQVKTYAFQCVCALHWSLSHDGSPCWATMTTMTDRVFIKSKEEEKVVDILREARHASRGLGLFRQR